jgi:murein DD-endopeptidase MepM/ murein hydrolase activator NlpD
MSRRKYFYNTQSLQFEELKVPMKTKLARGFSMFCAILVAATVLYVLADRYLPSQKEKALMREINEMKFQYSGMTAEIGKMTQELTRIQQRDAHLHRFMLDMEPIDESIWTAGVGGSDEYAPLDAYRNAGKIMKETHLTVDQLKRQLSIQAKSLDTIEAIAIDKEDRIEAIPSIKPVRVDLLKRNISMLSGFGIRLHPVHKVNKMHYGLDFTAIRGTAIQSTGNGVVIHVRKSKSGYGRNVIIDHGYGYTTLYGHMDEIHVRVGDKVKKGEQIGTVGSTGTSTAPHCHYEVRLKGVAVDPIHFCLDELSPAEYAEVVERASSAKQSFD